MQGASLKIASEIQELVDTFVDPSMIYADAPNEIKVLLSTLAQEVRLQILKLLDAQAAPEAVFPNHQMCKILKINCICLGQLLILQLNVIVSFKDKQWPSFLRLNHSVYNH